MASIEETLDQIFHEVLLKQANLKGFVGLGDDCVLFGPQAVTNSLSMVATLIEFESVLLEKGLLPNPILTPDFFDQNRNHFRTYHSLRNIIIGIRNED